MVLTIYKDGLNLYGMKQKPPKDVKDVIKAAGGATALAAALGISKAAVSQWRRIPIDRVADVERISHIPRHELRPDIFLRVA